MPGPIQNANTDSTRRLIPQRIMRQCAAMDVSDPPAVDAVPPDPGSVLDAHAKRSLLWLIAFSFFMQMLDSTIVNTAAPSIAAALAVTPLSIKTALISYTLSLAVFIPLSAWLADRYGTRRIFWGAIATFTVGSLACGLAQNLPMLVVARVVQGIGGALMIPVGRLAILRSFSKAEFVGAMAFATIPGLIGPAIGPFLGGVFSTWLSWRMIFFVNLPFGLAGLWMTLRYMPDYRSASSEPLDLTGFVLFGLGVGGVSWALEQVIEADYNRALLAGLPAIALLVFYAWRSLRISNPIVDLRLLRVPSFRIGVNGSFSTRLGVGGIYFLMTLLFQVGFGYSPVMAGLLQTPQAIAMLSTRFFVASIIRHLGYRRVLVVNTVLAGVMILSFATFDANTPLWRLCMQVFLFGMVMSIQYTAVNTLGFVDLTPAQASMGSSMSSTAQNLSISFGVAFGSLLMACFMPVGAVGGQHYIHAFHITVIILGIVTMLSSAVFYRVARSSLA